MRSAMGKIVMAVLALFLAAYVTYQAVDYFYDPYTMETVYEYTFQDSVSCRGVIIRSETVLEADYTGVPDYIYKDGSMISKGMAIAEIYPSAQDILNRERVKELEAEIDMLRDSQDTAENYLSVFETIGSQISEVLGDVVADMRSGDVSDIAEKKTRLMTLVNRRRIISGAEESYDGRIAELEKQIEGLNSRTADASGYITAETKGYFSSVTDGYENVLSLSAADGLTIPDVEALLAGKGAQRLPSSAVGKMVTSYKWYYAALIDAEDAERFRNGMELYLFMDSSDIERLPVTVANVVTEEGNDSALVLFSCGYMSEQLSRVRYSDGEISFGTISGLRIPERSVRMVDGVRGVYVLKKQTVRYKPIEVIYNGTGFVIVKWDSEDQSALQLFDEIFVGGNKLYEGKQMD